MRIRCMLPTTFGGVTIATGSAGYESGRNAMHTEEHARQMFEQWAVTGKIESDEIGRTGTGDRFDTLRLLCNALTDDDNRMPREVSEKFASNGAEGMLWSYRDGPT